MNNWSSSWRKLVEWDEKVKMYSYKGYMIIPLSYLERRNMPTHLQNEYYWDEIGRLDKIIELEGKEEKEEQDKKEFDFNAIWDILGWNE